MEFNEKLQALRKQKGLTQEELAQALFVSRTAISKWESGRGYPNIESLKHIARFFSVTVDELLSGGEVLAIAEEDSKERTLRLRTVVFGLLDIGAALLVLLPLFGQKTDTEVRTVSLFLLERIPVYLRTAYCMVAAALPLWGILTLALQNFRGKLWLRLRQPVSLAVNAAGMLLFIVSQQPYPAVFLFLLLAVKVCLTMTRNVSVM